MASLPPDPALADPMMRELRERHPEVDVVLLPPVAPLDEPSATAAQCLARTRHADRVLATRLGAAAIDALDAGRHGVLVGMLKSEITATPLAEIAGRTRPADAALLEMARAMAI